MTTEQLSIPMLITAIVFAAFIAALSIDEARRLRKESVDKDNRDRRERLLNEIIEWATDVLKGGDLETSCKLASENIRHEVRQTLLSMSGVDTFEGFKTRSLYILLISRTLGDNLENAVEKAIQELNKITELLYKLVGADTFEGIEELGKQKYELLNPAINAVIEQATNLKIKDIC